MTRRSSWGSVRRVSSGRFQAKYRVAGVLHLAPHTFRTKREAHALLAGARADVERGAWVDPDAGKIPPNQGKSRSLVRPAPRQSRQAYALNMGSQRGDDVPRAGADARAYLRGYRAGVNDQHVPPPEVLDAMDDQRRLRRLRRRLAFWRLLRRVR